MNILADRHWRSVLSELFVELGGAWMATVLVVPDATGELKPLILRMGLGILSLLVARNLRAL